MGRATLFSTSQFFVDIILFFTFLLFKLLSTFKISDLINSIFLFDHYIILILNKPFNFIRRIEYYVFVLSIAFPRLKIFNGNIKLCLSTYGDDIDRKRNTNGENFKGAYIDSFSNLSYKLVCKT